MIGQVKRIGKIVTVELEGVLELGQEARLKEALLHLVPTDSANLLLDLSKLSFIDSACLGGLISVARFLREKGGDLKLLNPQLDVTSILQITRLDKVFSIFSNLDEALASF